MGFGNRPDSAISIQGRAQSRSELFHLPTRVDAVHAPALRQLVVVFPKQSDSQGRSARANHHLQATGDVQIKPVENNVLTID
jgi:hypothetical protein